MWYVDEPRGFLGRINPKTGETWYSARSRDLYGVDGELHLDARTLKTYIHPEDWDRVVAESMAGEASLKPFSLEARYKRHDGVWCWLRSVSRPRFGPDGELLGYIGAAFDITVAKRTEEDLQTAKDNAEDLAKLRRYLEQQVRWRTGPQWRALHDGDERAGHHRAEGLAEGSEERGPHRPGHRCDQTDRPRAFCNRAMAASA